MGYLRRVVLVLFVLFSFAGVRTITQAEEIDTTTLNGQNITITQGSSGYMDISLNNVNNIAALSFDIYYNAEFLDVGYVYSTSSVESMNPTYDYTKDGEIHFSMATNGENLTSNGTILGVYFNVENNAPIDIYQVEIVVNEAYDDTLTPISIDGINGRINVEEMQGVIKDVYIYSSTSLNNVSTGDTFDYRVYSYDLKGFSAGNFEIYYDSSYLRVSNVSFSSYFDTPGALSSINTDYDGFVEISYASIDGITYANPMFTIEFEVIGNEDVQTEIKTRSINMVDENLLTLNGNETVRNVSIEKIVQPIDYPDLYITNYGGPRSETFDLYVKVESNSALAAGDFTIQYDSNLLEVLSVDISDTVSANGGYLFYNDDIYNGTISFSYINENGLQLEETFLIITVKAKEGTTANITSMNITGSGTVDDVFSDITLDYVSGDIEFYEVFEITFIDYDSSVISSVSLKEGNIIEAPIVTLRTNTVFSHWSEPFSVAQQNQTIQAVYSLDEENILLNQETFTYNGQSHSLSVDGLPEGATVVYTNNDQINVGSYTVIADIYLDEVYQFSMENTLIIEPKEITLTIGDHERVYGDIGEIPYTVEGIVGTDDLQVDVFTNDGYDVGEHQLTATIDNDNYSATIIDGTLTITKATYDMSEVYLPSTTVVYDGNTHSVNLEGTLPIGVSVSYINNEQTSVGVYTVNAVFTGDTQNYKDIPNMTATLTIIASTITGVEFTDKIVTYTGESINIELTNIPAGATVVYSPSNTFTNAGSYTVTAIVSLEGHDDLELTAALTIKKATYDMSEVTFSNQVITYDGTSHILEISGTLPNGVTVSYINNEQTSIGTYDVTAEFVGDSDNYEIISNMTATLTIEKATMVGVEFNDKTVTYTGEEHLIEVTGLPVGATVTYDIINGYTNAGTYTVTATISLEGYYDLVLTATLTIEKAIYDMSEIGCTDLTVVYDGTAHSIGVTGTLPSGVTVDYINNDQILAGTYTVTAIFSGDVDNYEEIPNMTAVLTIEKATYDMSGITFVDQTITYDGNNHTLEIGGTLPNGVTVNYINNGQTTVGTYSITVEFNGDSDNYENIPSMSATLTIEKATYDMSAIGFTNLTVVYDGASQSIEATGTLPSGVTVDYINNEQILVGTYTVTAIFSGDLDNYEEIPNMTAVLTIEKATYDMSAIGFEDLTVVYDGTFQSIEVTGTLPSGVTVDYVNNEQTTVGIYSVTANFTGDSNNYEEIESMTAILTITKATYDMSGLTFPEKTYTYGGNIYSVEIDGDLPTGVTVNYENNDQTDVGIYTVTANFIGDSENYEVIPSMTTTLTIEEGSMSGVEFVNRTETYDGSNHILEVTGAPVTATVVYDIGNSFIDAGSYEITATISNDGYEDMVLIATLTIEKATYDMSGISFINQSVTYDGNNHTLEISGTLPNGVTVSYLNNGQTSVGTYNVTAEFTGDGDNYEVIPSMTADLMIEGQVLTGVYFNDKTVQYNAQSQLLEVSNLPAGATVTYSPSNSYINAGEYLVTATVKLEGYQDLVLTATLTINKIDISIYADNKSSVYGETLQELTYRIIGTVYNNEVQVYLQKEGSSDVGTYSIVVNASGFNYNITKVGATYTISKATYDLSNITFGSETFVYDGNAHSVFIDGTLPPGVRVTYTGNNQTDVGSYNVVANFTSTNTNYYDIPSKQARMVIEPALIEGVTFPSMSVDYDGQLHTIEVRNLPNGATVTYSPSNSFTKSGTHQVTAIVSKHGYRDLIITTTLSITGQDIDVSNLDFSAVSYTYDGEEKSMFITGNLPEGVIGIDYSNNKLTNVGKVFPIVRFIVDEAYNPLPNMTTTLEVTKAVIQGVTFTGGEFVYDGESKEFILSSTISQYGDEIDVEYSGELSYVNAGTYSVSVTLTHDNYQELVIESTLTIDKADRSFTLDDFSYFVSDHSVLLEVLRYQNIVYYSVNDEPFVLGNQILDLEEDSVYTISVYLDETANYHMSNIVTFEVKTYLSKKTVITKISSISEMSIDTRETFTEIMNDIEKMMENDQEDAYAELDLVIEEYNTWIQKITHEYNIAENIEKQVYPMELFMINYYGITLDQIKRREQR